MNMLHFEEFEKGPDGARVFRTFHCPPFKLYETPAGTYLEVYYAGAVNDPVPTLLSTSYDHAKVHLMNQIHNNRPTVKINNNPTRKEGKDARKLDS